MQLMARFYDVDTGAVYMDGTQVKDYTQTDLLNKIGYVPQKSVLFEGSIRDNLKWGNENASESDMWNALALAQADEIVRGKEGQLDAYVEQGGRNFSGGQKQRLCLARAFIKKPAFLLLDDASSALDYVTELKVRQGLSTLKDTTIVMVSQRISSIRHADTILVLDDGCLVGVGAHEQLLKNCEVYQEIYQSQYGEVSA